MDEYKPLLPAPAPAESPVVFQRRQHHRNSLQSCVPLTQLAVVPRPHHVAAQVEIEIKT